jgi:hypothetical protein
VGFCGEDTGKSETFPDRAGSICFGSLGPVSYLGQLPEGREASTPTPCSGIWTELSVRLMGRGGPCWMWNRILSFLLCGPLEICIWISP